MSRRNFGFERNRRKTSNRNIGYRTDTEFLEPRALMASNVADAPIVHSVTVPEPRTFGNGQAISFVLKFNERVEVDSDAVIPVEVGIGRRTAQYVSGSGSRSIVFRMNVTDNDIDTDGIRLGQVDEVTGEYDFDFAGAVRDADGNSASDAIPRVDTRGIRVDAIGPRITGITDFIVKGNVISVYVKFDKPLRFSTSTIGGAITVPAPGSLRPTVLERLNAPYIDFEIDGEPAKLKFVPGNQGVQSWNGMVRSARFVYIENRDRDTEKLSLAFSKIKENQSLIVVPQGLPVYTLNGTETDFTDFRSGDTVIDSSHGPIELESGSKLTITPAGKLTGDYLTSRGIVYGRGDAIAVNNQGLIDTILGNNAPAVLIEGAGARAINSGELRLGGNNSPGIEIRGDDAYVEHTGFIHSQYAGSAAEAEPGHEFGNNEGISVNGLRANVKINGHYEGRAGNAEFVSLAGNDITLNAIAIAQTYGIQSEIYSISGLKGDEPALGFSANIQGQYITYERESEFVSITSIGGTLDANATFDSFGNQSEGYSISGKDITAKIAGAVTTRGKDSEGVSLSKLANGTGGNLTATISADLTTEGDDSEGISLQADNSSLTVISEIRTSGRNSEGISVTGQGISFRSTDNLIETHGLDSEGISLTGTGPQLIDASIGSLIRTTGDDSEGISIMGNNVYVDLSSHIFTNGLGSAGILIKGDNINVILRGEILTYGEGSPGITIEGNHIIVEISGSISTSGKDSPVILVRGGSDITIDCGSDASFTAAQSPVFSNPSGVHVDGNFPQSG